MQIHWRHPDELSDAERETVEQRIRGLADGHTDLIDVWIDVEPSSGHHRSGDEHVTIHASVRRGRLVARGDGAHIEIALRKAIDTFARNVWNMRQRRNGRRHIGNGRPDAETEEGFEPSDSG